MFIVSVKGRVDMGFYSTLEKVSDWIDYKAYRLREILFDEKARLFYLAGLTGSKRIEELSWLSVRISDNTEYISDNKRFNGDVFYEVYERCAMNNLAEMVALYNREKYWWMKRK